ncbi:MAG TPA: hypothetical protein DEQ88_00130 [Clostridiales bacterium]|nr:hypothetical protein [Clostridiales bacterium]
MASFVSIEDLIAKEYEQRYFDECRFIWQNYVPKSGQARNLQGELLREIEKIRIEAQDNGNVNWDDDFSYFCDFIAQSLVKQTIFSETEKEEIIEIMSYLKARGEYAARCNSGEISADMVQPENLAYLKDNLYDVVCDAIGKLQSLHPEPICYKRNKSLKR